MAPDRGPWHVAAAQRGSDGPLTVLLHGQGAAGVVWDGVVQASSASGSPGRFIIPDLPGHGRSGRLRRYTSGAYAAAVADVIPLGEPVVVVGHSLGGLVALTLASGHFGIDVAAVLCLAVKVRWTEEEAARRARRAARPARRFTDRDEARAAFSRVAGLEGRATPEDLDVGVAVDDGRFALAHDPATAALPPVAAEQVAAAWRGARCPVRLVCGDADRMVAPDDMAAMGGEVEVVPGAGHNLHVESPDLVARLVEQTTGGS